ncbi:putative Tail fiber protein [Gammaproteobacteria bacterium]
MTADFAKPVTSDQRDDVLAYIRDNFAAIAKMALTGSGNIPTDSIQLDQANRRFQKYNGATWDTVHILPAGLIAPYGGAAAPDGWLLCDGTAVSRSTYAALFTAISTTYGVGNGSTTFNLPDLRGRFPLGKAAAGTGSTLGGTGGALDHTHTGPSHSHTLSSHTHDMSSHTHTLSAHTHTMKNHTHSLNSHVHAVGGHYHELGHGGTLAVASGGSHTHDMKYLTQTAQTGAGASYRQMTASSSPDGTVAVSSDGAHTHTLSGSIGLAAGSDGDAAFNTAGAAGSTGSPSDNTSDGPSTANTSAPSTANTAGPSTANTGSDGTAATGSNNAPYQVVNYIIKV